MVNNYSKLVDEKCDDFSSFEKLIEGTLNDERKHLIVRDYNDLVSSNKIKKFTATILNKISIDPEFSPFWISDSEIPIFASEKVVLSLRYYNGDVCQDALYSVPDEVYFTLLESENNVEVDVFDIVFDKQYKLVLNSKVKMQIGDTIKISRMQTFKIKCKGDACFSRLLIGLGEGLHIFDSSDYRYISMLSLNPNSSRWYFMAKVAGQLSSEQAIPILNELVKHSEYNVRWTALQELFMFSLDDALKILENFKNDESEFISKKAISEHERIREILELG